MTTRSTHSLSSARNLVAGTAFIAATLLLTACGKKEKSMETASAKPATPAATAPATTTPAGFESIEQRVSYGVGFKMASGIAQQKDFKVDRTALIAGIDDALAGGKLRLDEKDISAAFMEMQQRAEAAAAEAGKANIALGDAYLATNKAKPGVKTTASGLQYEVLKSGTGAKPKPESTVQVHYHGTLIDGKVFDSSVERNEPIEFAVQGVIPGWTEALQLMSVGDKWKLTIPSALAYGPRGAGADIPPNSVLVFEVELLAIK